MSSTAAACFGVETEQLMVLREELDRTGITGDQLPIDDRAEATSTTRIESPTAGSCAMCRVLLLRPALVDPLAVDLQLARWVGAHSEGCGSARARIAARSTIRRQHRIEVVGGDRSPAVA